MRYGISAAVLVICKGKVLLVNHKQAGSYDFWVPPGGSLEGSESIYECAKREMIEETGLSVKLDKILYIQEFWEPGYHFCKFFIWCTEFSGNLTLANKTQAEGFLVDVRYFAQDEMQDLVVHPQILKDRFWDHVAAGHPVTHYLGLERIRY